MTIAVAKSILGFFLGHSYHLVLWCHRGSVRIAPYPEKREIPRAPDGHRTNVLAVVITPRAHEFVRGDHISPRHHRQLSRRLTEEEEEEEMEEMGGEEMEEEALVMMTNWLTRTRQNGSNEIPTEMIRFQVDQNIAEPDWIA